MPCLNVSQRKLLRVIMLSQEEARHSVTILWVQSRSFWVAEGTASRQSPEILGVNLIEAREEVETIIGRGSGFIGVEIPFTPRSKRIFELCLEEASLLGRPIGTEHCFWAWSGMGKVAARVLENLGLTQEKSGLKWFRWDDSSCRW